MRAIRGITPGAMLHTAACLALLPLAFAQEPPRTPTAPPNVVVIFVDDLGYADIGPFGGEIPTPNLDRMAQQGMRFSDFSVSSAVCSASRAALLTGCYHQRVGIAGALGPDAKIGLHDQEVTIAELCRTKGYATACFGKWHLGHHPQFLPLRHGFDEWFGLPYSNDMWPLHPDYAKLPADAEKRKRGYPPLPLFDGERVVDAQASADAARADLGDSLRDVKGTGVRPAGRLAESAAGDGKGDGKR